MKHVDYSPPAVNPLDQSLFQLQAQRFSATSTQFTSLFSFLRRNELHDFALLQPQFPYSPVVDFQMTRSLSISVFFRKYDNLFLYHHYSKLALRFCSATNCIYFDAVEVLAHNNLLRVGTEIHTTF